MLQMTIFGFNTDVKHGDVVYHVQTEARPRDLLLQTLVFLKGQCVSKRASSYARKTVEPGFSEQEIHELLKTQHRQAIEAIQQGSLSSVAGSGHVEDVDGTGLSLNCISADSDGAALRLAIEVRDQGRTVQGARIVVTETEPGVASTDTWAETDDKGLAGITVPLSGEIAQDPAVMVRATHQDKSVTRRIRFRP